MENKRDLPHLREVPFICRKTTGYAGGTEKLKL